MKYQSTQPHSQKMLTNDVFIEHIVSSLSPLDNPYVPINCCIVLSPKTLSLCFATNQDRFCVIHVDELVLPGCDNTNKSILEFLVGYEGCLKRCEHLFMVSPTTTLKEKEPLWTRQSIVSTFVSTLPGKKIEYIKYNMTQKFHEAHIEFYERRKAIRRYCRKRMSPDCVDRYNKILNKSMSISKAVCVLEYVHIKSMKKKKKAVNVQKWLNRLNPFSFLANQPKQRGSLVLEHEN
jgi:hypothetical protein